MWESETKVDKYLYTRSNPLWIKFLGIAGVFSILLMSYGYWQFFHLNIFYLIIFGTIGAIFIFNRLIRYTIQIFYPKFDIKKHEKFIDNFWKNNPEPAVDVFLPYAGEDLNIHEQVVKAVSNLDYKNYKVYMLDDAGNEEHEKLAKAYGFNYLSRPNRGEFKKSGNLEFGYKNSNGKYIFILDADFIPTKDSLKNLIPYMASDDKIGILQTPQYLEQTDEVHKRSKIEFGGGNVVEEFYKIDMPCRDVFKAGMCVGTSAIYKRETVDVLNGTPKVHASEDLATGLLITQYGYYVKYLPLIVSIGKSPETFQGYFKQHQRWCSGNTVFAEYWPKAKLNVIARLIYLSNPTYYFSEALSVIFPFHFLALLYFNSGTLKLSNIVYFLPYMIYSHVILPLIKTHRKKTGTRLAALSNSYTYLHTLGSLLFKKLPTWHPTGLKISGFHRDFLNSINLSIVISSTFILSFIFVILSKPNILANYNTYIILGWSIYTAFWHAVYISSVSKFIKDGKIKEANHVVHKAYLYAKTYLLVFLFSLLISSIIADSLFVIHPTSPILATNVVHKIFNNQEKEKPTAIEPSSQNPIILTANPTTKEEYIYTISEGDYLIKIAKDAVLKYANLHNIVLTDQQAETIASQVIKKTYGDNTAIKPGDKVEFKPSVIESEVASAKQS